MSPRKPPRNEPHEDPRDQNDSGETAVAQVITLPRCRPIDGGCGSLRVHCYKTLQVRNSDVAIKRYYSCLQCGNKFFALILDAQR